MDLFFLRHGKAVEPGTHGVADDFSRELTPKGIAEMESEAEAFELLAIRPDVILTSPLLRAKQTAEIVARRLGLKKQLIETGLLEPGCDLDRLRKLLGQHASCARVLLVGHEPDLGELSSHLLGASTPIPFRKGGVCRIDVRGVPMAGAVLRCTGSPTTVAPGHSRATSRTRSEAVITMM